MGSLVQDLRGGLTSLPRYFFLLVALALALRVVLAFHVIPDRLLDDGYITLRYAANLVQGQGFVYNKGEPVWGTTTPLLTLLLYLSASLFGVSALEASALVFSLIGCLIFWFATIVVLEDQRVPRLVSMPVLLVILFSPAFVANSVSGMETPLVLALMMLSLYASLKERPVLLGLLFALLLMARIDTLIWIGIIGGAYIVRHLKDWRALALALGTFVLASLPWHVYAYLTFHTLVPQTVTGKAVSHDAFQAVDWAYFVRYFQVYFPVGHLGWLAPVGIVLTLGVLLVGLIALWRRHPGLGPVGLFFFCFAGSFYLSRAPLFMWYFPPAQWVAYLLLCTGLYALWDQWPTIAARRLVRLAPWCILTAAIILQAVVGVRALWLDRAERNGFLDVGAFITAHSTDKSKVFVEHIGIIGFRSGRTILDNMGLVSPEVADLKKQHPDKWLTLSLRQFRPDVVVLYPFEDPRTAPARWDHDELGWFAREYRLVKEFDTTPATSVYLRKVD
jgi:hypothetical protein